MGDHWESSSVIDGEPFCFSYYLHYILNAHGSAQVIEVSPCRRLQPVPSRPFRAWPAMVLYLLRAGLACLLTGVLSRLLLLPSFVCETLEKIGVMAALHDSGFDMFLGYMAYSRRHDVDWLRCRSSWFPFNFSTGKASDVPSRRPSSTRRRHADGDLIGDHSIPAIPVHFVAGTSLHYLLLWCGRRWFPEYYTPEVLVSVEASEVPDDGFFDAHAANVEGEGDWDLPNLTSDLDLGHRASFHFDYDYFRGVCLTVNLSPRVCYRSHLSGCLECPFFIWSFCCLQTGGCAWGVIGDQQRANQYAGVTTSVEWQGFVAKVMRLDHLDGELK